MGCGSSARKKQEVVSLKEAAVVPDGSNSAAISAGDDTAYAFASSAKQAEEESLGNSDDDEGIDDDSSGSEGLPPEQQWAKQSRRQARQKKRRQRARRRAARAAAEGEGAPPELDAVYSVGERLGRGTYASVSRCTHLQTQAERALKTIDRKKCSGEEQIREEIEIMRLVSHPQVVRFFDVFEDARFINIVMEICSGGELFDLVCDSKGLDEDVAVHVVGQIASAMRYLHSVRVAHRDLKPENVMLSRAGESLATGIVKVIDFSLSRRFEPGTFMQTLACTPHYVAPEVLSRKYTEACDMWSFGVMIYVLLSGSMPFDGPSESEVLKSIEAGWYEFDEQRWSAKSAATKDLIQRLLRLDASARMTAEQVPEHPWLREHVPP